MYFELMCNLMCTFDACSLPPYVNEKRVWNEIKVRFSKHYDNLSIFK